MVGSVSLWLFGGGGGVGREYLLGQHRHDPYEWQQHCPPGACSPVKHGRPHILSPASLAKLGGSSSTHLEGARLEQLNVGVQRHRC